MDLLRPDSPTTPSIISRKVLTDILDNHYAIVPTIARLSIDANRGTPTLAAQIARVLASAGAEITFDDERARDDFLRLPYPEKSLTGLRIHIGQLTWVRDEEAQRWGVKP